MKRGKKGFTRSSRSRNFPDANGSFSRNPVLLLFFVFFLICLEQTEKKVRPFPQVVHLLILKLPAYISTGWLIGKFLHEEILSGSEAVPTFEVWEMLFWLMDVDLGFRKSQSIPLSLVNGRSWKHSSSGKKSRFSRIKKIKRFVLLIYFVFPPP
jgi:hypothetical protein